MSRQNCQIFVRHVDKSTTDSSFESYFNKFGKVVFHKILRDNNGRSKGCGLVAFAQPSVADTVLNIKYHLIDGRKVECKRYRQRRHRLADKYKDLAKNNHNVPKHLKKLYVGSLGSDITQDQLKVYFSLHGDVENAYIVKDKDQKSKGYGFVIFRHPASIDKVQDNRPHIISNKEVHTVRGYPDNVTLEDKKPTTVLYVLNYKEGIDVTEIEHYFSKFGDIVGSASRNKKAENLKYIELEFEDYDSVDVICLTRKHIFKDCSLTVQKYLTKGENQEKPHDKSKSSNDQMLDSELAPCAPPLEELCTPAYNPYHTHESQLYPSLPTVNYSNSMTPQTSYTNTNYTSLNEQLNTSNKGRKNEKNNCTIC